jgi:transcriptional regulator with XRE-family HTH domain
VAVGPDISPDSDEPVGRVLARMRRAKGLTGAELARSVGMSQPKISRIERGQVLADPGDIGEIARALGADEALAHGLMDRAERMHNRITDLRPTTIDLADSQQDMAKWESDARVVRNFECGAVTGLLQTSGYARSVLVAFQRLAQRGTTEPSEALVLSAVAQRMRRQQLLADRGKSFRFVMTETVLRNRICSPAEMLAQIDHLQDVSTNYDNVVIGIVPDEASLTIPPLHGFALLDDKLVVIDAFNTGLTSRGPSDAERYRQVFDAFEELSRTHIEPILNKYRRLYIDLLRDPDDPKAPASD